VVVAVMLLVHSRYAGRGDDSQARTYPSSPTATPTVAPTTEAGSWKLVQLPQSGTGPLLSVITHARHTVDMTMYELQDPQIVDALTAAQHRGVRVRVVLNGAYSGRSENRKAYQQLQSGDVQVKWGPSGTIVHQKTITADAGKRGAVAAIGTGNLQPQYYADTLDAWVLDTDQKQIRAIDATFDSDWAAVTGHLGAAIPAAGLVWSPGDEGTLVATIDSARSEVQFSGEELSDKAVIAALATRAKAGVRCQILMTAQSEYSDALSRLSSDGCVVRTYKDASGVLYVHEKQLIVDGSELLIGSQNASVASLDYDRELSLVLTSKIAPSVLSEAKREYATVFGGATPWR
jgi:phosphatidylserine/phosphatidylglycerophosphate/cardiolipin synthase-like enzyme